ncbi:hypothetical protein CPB84DRAFT_1843822 [Gymnopilus junonius]|uniref:Ubiquitin-like protease family profile domain-containing protein n=1 Tax=Gymnopilus junonius TaxID=109634 RepID=A0A9P5NUX1_GYMJU|nr:hypothetical protein CPB84DRAFT_1843822 [Gymnopilus junonius]
MPVFKPTLPPASSTPLCSAAHPQPSSNTSATLLSIENATLPSSLSRAAAHPHTSSNVSSISANPETSAHPREPSECLRSLRQLCPACFGGSTFGRDLADGGDFQIATDGNFHHRHLVSGGQSVPFHDPKHIIPKSFIDEVGEAILKARRLPPKKQKPKVPDSAVDECEKVHDTADGDKKKVRDGRYDNMGWMSLVCCHDIPLFFANIDTPGEQQKYAIALILWFFALVPPDATATVLYDIACITVSSHACLQFNLLPQHIVSRIQFVTTAMHAYGHQWSCQLMYNPRLCRGLGLTDGEGVERIWARLRKLISIVRTSSHARQLWMTDRQLSAIAVELRDDLGDWIKHCHHRGVQDQGNRAKSIMANCGMSESSLQAQWDLQKAAQLSVRVHAPARLRKELDLLLSLQGDLKMVEKSIHATEALLATSTTPEKSKKILQGLYGSHAAFTKSIDELYVSLNFYDSYPDLKGANLEFVRLLLLALDLKINIRKEMHAAELAIQTPQFRRFIVQLVHYRDYLLHLKSRWSSSLSLSLHFDAHVRQAYLIATELSAHQEITPPTAICMIQDLQLDNEVQDDLSTAGDDGGDELEDGLPNDEPSNEDDATSIVVSDILQADRDDQDDTCTLEFFEVQMVLFPAASSLLRIDTWLRDCQPKILSMAFSGSASSERSYKSHLFSEKELQMLSTWHALLNDICINGIAMILHDILALDPNRGCHVINSTIFTTYKLNRIRYKAPDPELWCNMHRTEYWTKETWILPIHRPAEQYWVLAVLHLTWREVYLYDSLARNACWKRDMMDIAIFISRLTELAKRSGYPMEVDTFSWVAKPVISDVVQTNGFDCGVWVLAWIAAALRGYEVVDNCIAEDVMPSWRHVLAHLVRVMDDSHSL